MTKEERISKAAKEVYEAWEKKTREMERAPKIKTGDIVWVNEATMRGTPLKHEWYGEIIKVKDERATVKDTTGGMYDGEIFDRGLGNLEKKL